MRLLLFIMVLSTAGVSAQFGWAGAAEGASKALQGLGGPQLAGVSDTDYLLFGGPNNDVFLGCLSCSELHPLSVRNTLGRFGSTLSPSSIVNGMSAYGSSISPGSACNALSPRAPVIVNRRGDYFGELTINTLNPRRTRIDGAAALVGALCRQR